MAGTVPSVHSSGLSLKARTGLLILKGLVKLWCLIFQLEQISYFIWSYLKGSTTAAHAILGHQAHSNEARDFIQSFQQGSGGWKCSAKAGSHKHGRALSYQVSQIPAWNPPVQRVLRSCIFIYTCKVSGISVLHFKGPEKKYWWFFYSHICPVLLPSLSSQHFSVDRKITNHTMIAVLFKHLLSFASIYAVHGLFETPKQETCLISTAQPSAGRL